MTGLYYGFLIMMAMMATAPFAPRPRTKNGWEVGVMSNIFRVGFLVAILCYFVGFIDLVIHAMVRQ